MASLLDEFNAMKIKINKIGLDAAKKKQVHIVDHDEEFKRKRTNPSKSTKIMLNCRTPEQWSEMQLAKERYFAAAKDPHIAIDLMIKALSAFSENVLLDWVKQGHDDGPPRAHIPSKLPGEEAPAEDVPEWMK